MIDTIFYGILLLVPSFGGVYFLVTAIVNVVKEKPYLLQAFLCTCCFWAVYALARF